MRVAILGATGRTGVFLVDQALAAGHQVVACVRSPDKIQTKHDNLEAKKVDIYNKETLVEGFQGCDAVMSCLGPIYKLKGLKASLHFHRTTIPIFVSAVKEAGVRRLVVMTAACVRKTEGEPMRIKLMRPMIAISGIGEDFCTAEDHLMEQCPDINVTIVKPPMMNNAPLDGQEIMTEIGKEHIPGVQIWVSRAHVAKIMIKALTENTWDNAKFTLAVQNAPVEQAVAK